jgi:hypothetical protein
MSNCGENRETSRDQQRIRRMSLKELRHTATELALLDGIVPKSHRNTIINIDVDLPASDFEEPLRMRAIRCWHGIKRFYDKFHLKHAAPLVILLLYALLGKVCKNF